jgi:hypothetical protein
MDQTLSNWLLSVCAMFGSQGIYVHQCATTILSSHSPYNYLFHAKCLHKAKPRNHSPCWNYGGSVEHNRKRLSLGSYCGAFLLFFLHSSYLVSCRYGSMYLSNLLMNQSPHAFARVTVLTRVNDSNMFILTPHIMASSRGPIKN